MIIGQVDHEVKQKQEYNIQKKPRTAQENPDVSGKVGVDIQEDEELFKAVEKLLETDTDVKNFDNTDLQYSIHEGTNQILIKVIDSESEEVIKELPSEKILDIVAARCREAGIFVDEKI